MVEVGEVIDPANHPDLASWRGHSMSEVLLERRNRVIPPSLAASASHPPSLPLPLLPHFHDIPGEVHGHEVVVEEEILRYSFKTVS